MAILARDEVRTKSSPIGGSPRGGTFLKSARCWRRWAARYLVGLVPATTKAHFDLGSAYHALMEGKSPSEVEALYGPEHLEVAQELAATRLKGPPLGAATAVEKEHTILNGMMTVKPDREEGQGPTALMRDYKTTSNFSDNDDAVWNTDPSIIGEMMGMGAVRGVVDLVLKRPEAARRVKLVNVSLTPAKEVALAAMQLDFWEQLTRRVNKVALVTLDAGPVTTGLINEAFPPNLYECTHKYGLCEYYFRCWGKAPESLSYKLTPEAPRAWVHGREDARLTLPAYLSEDSIERAALRVMSAWNLKRAAVEAKVPAVAKAPNKAPNKAPKKTRHKKSDKK